MDEIYEENINTELGVWGYIKVPLLWVMKGSYFGFGSPQQQVDMHERSKNTFIVL